MKSETREALATAIGIWLIIILLMFGFGYLLLRPPFGYRVDNVVGLITAVILGFQLVVFGRQAMRLHENVEATRDSIELANREFIATHRPRTLVQSVMIADRGSSRDKSNGLIDFMLANAGGGYNLNSARLGGNLWPANVALLPLLSLAVSLGLPRRAAARCR